MNTFLLFLTCGFSLAETPPTVKEPAPSIEESKLSTAQAPPLSPYPVNNTVYPGLSEEMRALHQNIANIASQQLSYYPAYPIPMPETIFDSSEYDRGVIRSDKLSSFLAQGNKNELYSLAFDSSGNRNPMLESQFKSIRRNGSFSVPSLSDPDQPHVWTLSKLLQKGTERTNNEARQQLRWAFSRLAVDMPNRLFLDKPFSFRRGLSETGSGLRALTSLFVGLPEYKKVSKSKWMESKLAPHRMDVQLELIKAAGGDDPRFIHQVDYSFLRSRLYEIQTEQETIWLKVAPEFQEAAWVKGKKDGLDDERIKTQVLDLSVQERIRRLQSAISSDKQLVSTFGSQFAQRCGDIYQKLSILKGLKAEAAKADAQAFEDLKSELMLKHPIRSQNKNWLEDKAKAEHKASDVDTKLLQALREAGLELEAKLLEARLEFEKNQSPGLLKKAERDWKKGIGRNPARVFEYYRNYWNPKVSIDNSGPKPIYMLDDSKISTIDTSGYFWRFQSVGLRSVNMINNAFKWSLKDQIWNGSFGLKSQFGDLFGISQFSLDYDVDESTGEFVVAEYSPEVYSYGKRLKDVWSRAKASRAAYDAKPDHGFLPKNFTRALHIIWRYGLRGPVETVAIGVGQPVGTVLNVGVSGGIGLGSVVWGPAVALLGYGGNTLLWDTMSPKRTNKYGSHPQFLAAPRIVVGDIGVNGLVQTVTAGAWGLAGEPTTWGLSTLFTSGRYLTRQFYDFLSYGLIIRPLGRIPYENGIWAYHSAGPKISEKKLLQLDSGVALLALTAGLEQKELVAFKKLHETEIRKPLKEYNAFMNKLLIPMGIKMNPVSPVLNKSERKNMKELNRVAELRERRLDRVLEKPDEAPLIRIKESEMESLKHLGAEVTQRFYQDRIFPLMTESQKNLFWVRQKLKKGNWSGVSQKILKSVLSENLFRPTKDFDQAMVVEISHPKLLKHFHDVIAGIPLESDSSKKISYGFDPSVFVTENQQEFPTHTSEIFQEIDPFTEHLRKMEQKQKSGQQK